MKNKHKKNNNQNNNDSERFGKNDTKIFEIILIIGLVICLILLITHLALTIWYFRGSDYILSIEIILLILNFVSLILSIILRLSANNNSVLVNYISIIGLTILIINFLGSLIVIILFSLMPNFLSDNQTDKQMKFFQKIMNKPDKIKIDLDFIDKYKLLRSMTFACFIINLFLYLISFILLFMVKRKKEIKADSNTSFPNQSLKNMPISINGNSKDNLNLNEKNNKKTKKKKNGKKEEGKEQGSEIEKFDIKKKNKKKKKEKKNHK